MRGLTNVESTKHRQIMDALRYTLLLEGRAHASLWRALRRIESRDGIEENPSQASALTAIGGAWTMVDSVHRLRRLVRQVPKLSHKNAEVQLLIRNSDEVEEFRNLYQHLDTAVTRAEGRVSPVMGAISWVTREPTKSITIFPGSGGPNVNVHSLAVDTLECRFARNLQFTAGNKDIDLDSLHGSCERFRVFFEAWLAQQGWLGNEKAAIGILRVQIRSGDPEA